jgi:hypothetical protein
MYEVRRMALVSGVLAAVALGIRLVIWQASYPGDILKRGNDPPQINWNQGRSAPMQLFPGQNPVARPQPPRPLPMPKPMPFPKPRTK